MADWQNLPDDLLRALAEKDLDFSANIRFSSVCRSWRLVGLQERRRIVERQIPGLVITTFPPEQQQPPCSNSSRYYIPLTEIIKHHNKNGSFKMNHTTNHILLPWSLPERSLCIGSFRGCMLLLDYNETDLALRNPITGSQVSLPKNSRKSINHFEFQTWGFWYNRKVSMWSPHHSFSEWYVFVVLPLEKFLTYCRVGDSDWGIVDFTDFQQGELNYVVDALCLVRSLYVLLRAGELYCCDFDSGFVEKKKVASSSQIEAFKSDNKRNYLVEFNGQILLVRQITPPHRSFDVYKLDTQLNQWVELRDLGDAAVIVGFGQPFSVPVPAEESTELLGIKRNCIYFLEAEEVIECAAVYFNIHVFDLKTSTTDIYGIDHKFQMPRPGEPVRLPIPIGLQCHGET